MHKYDHKTGEYKPLTTDQLLSCIPRQEGGQDEAKRKAFRSGVAVEELWGLDGETKENEE